MVREGRCLPAQSSQTIRGGVSYLKGGHQPKRRVHLAFSEAHEFSSTSIMRQAAGPSALGAGMEAKLGDWCAARAHMLHRSKTASGDAAKFLVIIGADDWSFKTTALTCV